MKVPYNCPYCDQVSMRKWNLSKHIERRHKGKFDPFLMQGKTILADSLYQSQNNYDFSNSFLPKIDYSDPLQMMARLNRFNNLLNEVRQLSIVELGRLLREIRNLPQWK